MLAAISRALSRFWCRDAKPVICRITPPNPDVLNRCVGRLHLFARKSARGGGDRAYWTDLIALAEKYDFRIFADECYSEIYRDTPPVGALQVAHEIGADPERVVAFHSLSKRSNLAGVAVRAL